jgi:hypothetical protein
MSLKITIEFELRCDSCGKKSHSIGLNEQDNLTPRNLSLVSEDVLFKAMEKDGWVKNLNAAHDGVKHFCGDCVKEGKPTR